jgi:hypothetical protein
MWWLVLDAGSINQSLLEKGLSRGDKADLDYYRKAFEQSLHPRDSLDGFELYRGELKLGQGTICEDKACNLAVLTKQGQPYMYLAISKN